MVVTPLVLALGGQRQVDFCELGATVVYIVVPGQAEKHNETHRQSQKKKKKKEGSSLVTIPLVPLVIFLGI